MTKLLCLAALAGLISAAPAVAVMDLEAPTPAQILAEAKKKAYALPAAPAKPVETAQKAAPRRAKPIKTASSVWECYMWFDCGGSTIGLFSSASSCSGAGGKSWYGDDLLCHNL